MVTNTASVTLYHVRQAQDGTVTAQRRVVGPVWYLAREGEDDDDAGDAKSCTYFCRFPPLVAAAFIPSHLCGGEGMPPADGWTLAPGDYIVPGALELEIGPDGASLEDLSTMPGAFKVRGVRYMPFGGVPHVYAEGV